MPKKTQLLNDPFNKPIPAPVFASAVDSTTSYTPTDDQTVILGADAIISLDGVAVPMLQGTTMIFKGGVTYLFTQSTPLAVS